MLAWGGRRGQLPCPAQVCSFLKAAMSAGPLRLPKLANIAVYLGGRCDDQPAFHLGDGLAPKQGAQGVQGVCNVLGRLVATGILPALAQARVAVESTFAIQCLCVVSENVAAAARHSCMQLSHLVGSACCRLCCALARMTH